MFEEVSSFKYISLITLKRNDIRPIHSFKNKILKKNNNRILKQQNVHTKKQKVLEINHYT